MAADNLRERNSRRKMLRAIKESLEQLKNPYISGADLRHLGIQQLWMSMSLENEPLFFRPYNALIQPPEIDTLTDYYPEFDESPFRNAENLSWYLNQYFQNCTLPNQDLNPPGSSYIDFGSFKFGKLMDVFKHPRWQVQAAWNIAHATVPHMKVLMYSGIIGNRDELFRGELLAIIDVMCRRLNTKSLRPHIIAPVLLFSVVGMHHIRVLEAYFNGKELVVRATGLYDLEHRNHKLLIQLSKWWLGHASDRSTQEY
ncbi:conserved hypothetical protein [Histoplasma capsulatum var. duboisii H88]|uniref:Uncharacterized protein n=1 Tax=Ajellomyces capsulatus (strain H88) TaxID=544711 RepID=F0UG65_AJEC8|nr:conserved hypothetical protein [Histoplasma capsulatum var. duboisii H88]QSS55827.1 hypothetical protein I7I53_03819 [Histoplasma capsulatum var. duboisii H88]